MWRHYKYKEIINFKMYPAGVAESRRNEEVSGGRMNEGREHKTQIKFIILRFCW